MAPRKEGEGAALVPFLFEGEQLVRTLARDGEPWFVLADVCRILEIGNPRQAATRLDDDERSSVSATVISNDGGANPTIINESGLYSLILTSRKAAAKRFKKWVTAEVLPAIRKTGRYEATDKTAELAQQRIFVQRMNAATRALLQLRQTAGNKAASANAKTIYGAVGIELDMGASNAFDQGELDLKAGR